MVNSKSVKASKEIETNDKISIKFPPTQRIFKVLEIPKSRVGAKLVPDLMLEITPQEDLDLLANN